MKDKKTAVFLLILSLAASGFSSQDPEIKKFVQQVKDQAVTIVSVDPETKGDDMNALKEVIEDARIVCLGDSQHLMHEQYQLKHRLIRFLVEEMDFSHIVIEDSFYGTVAINQYIRGLDISPEDALKNIGGWYLWDTEEILSLIKWLRTYNDSVADERKVSYSGIDIQDPWPGIRSLYDYFEKTDPEYAEYLETHKQVFNVFNQPIWFMVRNGYTGLKPEQKQNIETALREILGRLETYRQKFTKAAGKEAFRDIVLVVRHLLKSHEFFMVFERSYDGGASIRETTMFENIIRIMETSGSEAKLIVWVHNAHAAKSRLDFLIPSMPESKNLELLGSMLKKKYGDAVKSFGTASLGEKKNEENFQGKPDVLDHILSKAGLDFCFLDFSKLAGRRSEKNLLRDQWKLTADQGGFLSLVPAEAYDGLFFIKHVTRARLSKTSSQRFGKLFRTK